MNLQSIADSIFNLISGVPVFFFISGFLIWDSINRTPALRAYAKKRFLRIYPELWVGVIIELVPVIIFYLPNIVWPDLVLFAVGQATIFQFWTPDSLRGYGYGTPNGSLWTICVIVQFYVVIWALRKVFRGKRILFHLGVLCISIIGASATASLEGRVPEVLFKLYKQTVIPYFWLFYLGILCSEERDEIIPFLKKHWYMFGIGLVAKSFVSFDIPCFYPLLHCVLLCGFVLSIAYAFPGLNVKMDISYGLYIYHMIVVNIFIELGLIENSAYFVIVMLISIILAWLSTILGKQVICRAG